MIEREFVKQMIKRLARIDASDVWGADLNPAQRAALEYLGRANRFSRKPSQVAEFLGSTRGTVSQTLKSLARKEFVTEVQSETDKRSISYDVTALGQSVLAAQDIIDKSLERTSAEQLLTISDGLRNILNNALAVNGQRPFGVCKMCRHFRSETKGGHCTLLDVSLLPAETAQICHEQEPAA